MNKTILLFSTRWLNLFDTNEGLDLTNKTYRKKPYYNCEKHYYNKLYKIKRGNTGENSMKYEVYGLRCLDNDIFSVNNPDYTWENYISELKKLVNGDNKDNIYIFLHDNDLYPNIDAVLANDDYHHMKRQRIWYYDKSPIQENVHLFLFQHEPRALARLLNPGNNGHKFLDDSIIEEFFKQIGINV